MTDFQLRNVSLVDLLVTTLQKCDLSKLSINEIVRIFEDTYQNDLKKLETESGIDVQLHMNRIINENWIFKIDWESMITDVLQNGPLRLLEIELLIKEKIFRKSKKHSKCVRKHFKGSFEFKKNYQNRMGCMGFEEF